MLEDDLSLDPSMMPTPVSGIFEMKVVIGFIRKLLSPRIIKTEQLSSCQE